MGTTTDTFNRSGEPSDWVGAHTWEITPNRKRGTDDDTPGLVDIDVQFASNVQVAIEWEADVTVDGVPVEYTMNVVAGGFQFTPIGAVRDGATVRVTNVRGRYLTPRAGCR